jgi:hypothetical protein
VVGWLVFTVQQSIFFADKDQREFKVMANERFTKSGQSSISIRCDSVAIRNKCGRAACVLVVNSHEDCRYQVDDRVAPSLTSRQVSAVIS